MTSDTRSSDEIERDIEARRRNLSSDIDELQDRLSIDGLVQKVSDEFRSHGGEIGQAVYDQVRSNPVPLALTGIGLAWMMFAGNNPPRQGPRLPPHRDGWSDGSAREPQAYRPRAGTSYDYSRTPSWARSSYSPYRGGEHDRSGPSAGDRMAHARDAAEDRLSGAADEARSAAGSAKDRLGSARDSAASRMSDAADGARSAAGSAKDRLGSARDAAGDRAARAGEALSDAGHSISHSISRFGRQIADGTEHLGEDARARVIAARHRAMEAMHGLPSGDGRELAADYYDRQPLVFGALALALGAAIGSAMPRTRTEDAYMGEASDDLIDEAERILAEERDKAKRVASATSDEVRNVVDENRKDLESKASGDKPAAQAARERIEEFGQPRGEDRQGRGQGRKARQARQLGFRAPGDAGPRLPLHQQRGETWHEAEPRKDRPKFRHRAGRTSRCGSGRRSRGTASTSSPPALPSTGCWPFSPP